MSKITVAALQSAFTTDTKANVATVDRLVREAAKQGANVILPPELFENVYFCTFEDDKYFALAQPFEGHPTIAHFSSLAKELGVVIPVSFFERDGQCYYNSLAMVDADGKILGLYRKSHIPDAVGYEEKYYFSPGDTGFQVWDTMVGKVGVAICWDQWFPETARAMALQGAEILLYPTAIGTEPLDPSIDSSDHWQRVMQGHAAANVSFIIVGTTFAIFECLIRFGFFVGNANPDDSSCS